MKAIKATYHKGKVKLAEKPAEPGPVEVLVVFPEPDDDPWEAILKEKKPRPALERLANEVRKEIARGRAKPMDFDQL